MNTEKSESPRERESDTHRGADESKQNPFAGGGASDFGSSSVSGRGEEFSSFKGDHMAVEMARLWVRDHQTTSMLGAFAVGVFVGALLRD